MSNLDKMRMESLNMTLENISKIEAMFPNCITEAKDENGNPKKVVNFDILRQMLSEDILEGDEAYEFTWVGKKAAIVEANKPIRKTLRPCKEESVDWDTTENLYIEGDNLEVLKLLQESYLGKVKMIYIDPPYNSGKDCFIYNDRFDMGEEYYSEQIREFDDEGRRQMKVNNTSNPRFHSSWCNMIYPLLMISRGLLSSDGVIFMSIDESEVANLRKIGDEIFGSSNYAGEIIWKNSSKNDEAYVSIQHEYILCYVKDKSENPGNWIESKEGIEEIFKAFDGFYKQYGNNWDAIHRAALQWYKQFPESNPIHSCKHYSWMDEKGVYFAADISGPNYGQYRYDVIHPTTHKVCKEPASGWRYPEKTMLDRISKGLVHFGKDETTIPNNKVYLKDTINQSLTSIKYKDGRVASKALTSLMGKNCFSNPKDVSLLKILMKAIGISDGDKILDFFSGSGTTAEAVMSLAVEKNINPHYIMIQWAEDLDDNLRKATGSAIQITKNAIKICDELKVPHLLTEIGKERIRRAGAKIKEENPIGTQDLDIGFRVLKLDDSNMNDVYYGVNDYDQGMLSMFESNIKEGRTDLDLLFGCILEWGLPLSLPHTTENINGFTIHNYNDGDLIACFDEDISDDIIKEIAKKQPLRVVFRDSSFPNSPSKINVSEIFKMLAPRTSVKVI